MEKRWQDSTRLMGHRLVKKKQIGANVSNGVNRVTTADQRNKTTKNHQLHRSESSLTSCFQRTTRGKIEGEEAQV